MKNLLPFCPETEQSFLQSNVIHRRKNSKVFDGDSPFADSMNDVTIEDGDDMSDYNGSGSEN